MPGCIKVSSIEKYRWNNRPVSTGQTRPGVLWMLWLVHVSHQSPHTAPLTQVNTLTTSSGQQTWLTCPEEGVSLA